MNIINRIIFKIRNNWLICSILVVSLILHILAIKEVGFKYNLNSDDLHYVYSGIEFLKSGKITMHSVISAQIMPGLTFFIATICFIFGSGFKLWVALKILYMLMGLTTIIVVYKTIRLYANKYISAIPCLFFLAVDYIWMDNLILTETPFILLFTLLIYHTLKLSIKPNKKDYIFIVIYYIMAVFIRPNVGIYPIFLIIFLLMKKYNFKLLIKQLLIAGVVLLLTLTPWTIRNYKIFGKLIPLTYGTGNPLLLGTYQGYGYPLDDELDYKKNVDDKMSDEMRHYLVEDKQDKDYMTKYYSLEYDGMVAKYRMQEWWKKNKKSMLISYCLYKPKELIYVGFYWQDILGIGTKQLLLIRKIELVLTALSLLLITIDKKRIKETLFIILVYLSQIAIYSYTFAFSRYAITMFFMRYIIIGFGIEALYRKIKLRRSRSESINNSTSIQRGTEHRKYNKQNKKNTEK